MMIPGHVFLTHLYKIGFLKPDQKVKRVVIDAHVEKECKVYIEMIGTSDLLNVELNPDLTVTIVETAQK